MIGIACMALLAPFAVADETIILRDLSRIESSEFSFDEFEIRTSEGNVIYWDEVVSGEIRSDQQPSFDKILAKSGLPLFRLRHRISIGDHSSLPEIAYGMASTNGPNSLVSSSNRGGIPNFSRTY